jgi:hypothetical protein
MPALVFCLLEGCSSNNPAGPSNVEKLKTSAANAVATIEGEVAFFRGKYFKNTLTSVVYTRDEYAAVVRNQPTIPAAQRDHYNRILKCEGLLHENEDYYQGYDSMIINDAGGFYKSGSDSVFIIVENGATALTTYDSFAIFHELIHAMQDQYYDLQYLENRVTSSDQYWALTYCAEGEAELLAMYYMYKLYYGYYPLSHDPVMYQFDLYEGYANHDLDSLHAAGEPLILYQPFLWAYYSYGPKFIDSVVGMNWSLLDNVVFASLPVKTSEIMHPQTYINKYRHVLNINGFINGLDTTQKLKDVDEFGELLTSVLFREWDFSTYASIAGSLLTDRMIVFSDSLTDSLRLIWYSLWSDSLAGSNFLADYAQIIARKRAIAQPVPVQTDSMVVYSDTVNDIYAEQSGNRVFVMEKYEPAKRDVWIQQLRTITCSIYTAKRAATVNVYPYIKKQRRARDGKIRFRPHVAEN